MKRILPVIALSLCFVFLINCNSKPTYSLEEKIGQMILAGFRGMDVDEHSSMAQQIKDYHLGGVILYDYDVPSDSAYRNIESPEQVKALVEQLKTYFTVPPFVAIDHEGGYVCRLKEKYGFEPTVSAQYLGELNNLDSTQFWADEFADNLNELGFNMNFSPVVDVNVNPDCPIIGRMERAFSDDPKEVSKHAKVFLDTYSQQNIMCALKHFPGHGSSEVDSHMGFTDISSTWTEIELEPYKELIGTGAVDMVMTAHVFNEFWDARFPATLSDNMIRNYLRKELKFEGVIVSDDMCMGAIKENYSLKASIQLAMDADVDLLIFSNNGSEYDPDMIATVCKTFMELVDEGKVSEERINESFNRIIKLKNKYLLGQVK